MKFYIQLVVVLIVFSFISCKKGKDTYEVTVVKNCTGDYFLYKEDHFKICNNEILKSYDNGDVIKTDFSKIKECDESNSGETICQMYFDYYSFAEIIEIY